MDNRAELAWNKISPAIIQQNNKLAYTRRYILSVPFAIHNIISYGFIVYAKNTRRIAIVQRKHTPEFLVIIRGMYRLTYLPLLLSNITDKECIIIKRCIIEGPELFIDIYLRELGFSQDSLEYALIRIAETRNIISSLLDTFDLSQNTLSWNYPKGRLNISSKKEIPLECAKREFTEEVEIILPLPLFISETYLVENIKTIFEYNIESRYWIYIIPHEVEMSPPNVHQEISNRMWANIEECERLLLRKDILHQAYNIILSLED